MTNFISLPSSSSSAQLENFTPSNGNVFELQIQTNVQNEQQSLLWVVGEYTFYKANLGNGGFQIYLQGDQIGISFVGPLGHNWSYLSPDTTPVTDGAWHHIAIQFTPPTGSAWNPGSPQSLTLYKDGVQVGATVPQTAFAIGQLVPNGPLMVGACPQTALFQTSAAGFTGAISEIRIWDSPGNFSPTPYGPVPVSADGLIMYWPFWSNYTNGMCDVVSGYNTPAILTDATIDWANDTYYCGFNDAIMNAVYQPFPGLNANQDQSNAVTYILTTLAQDGTIDPNITDLTEFRQLYQSNSGNLQPIYDKINGYSCPDNTDPQDWGIVQNQLLSELQAVSTVYTYVVNTNLYADAYVNFGNTLLNTCLNQQQLPNPNTEGSIDSGAILDIVSAALSLAFAAPAPLGEPRRGRRSGPSEGPTAGDAINMMSALIGYVLSGQEANDANVVPQVNAVLTGECALLGQQFATQYTSLIANVTTSATTLYQDWGKLAVIAAYPDNCAFPYQFDDQVIEVATPALGAYFTQQLLCAAYQCWCFSGASGSDFSSLGLNGYTPNTFLYTYTSGQFGSAIYAICDFDSSTASVNATPSDDAVAAMQGYGMTSSQVIWNGGFTTELYNDGAIRRVTT